MKITELPKKSNQSLNTVNIKTGTVFRGTIGSVTGVFLRVFEGVISLSDAHDTWLDRPTNKEMPTVENFEALDAELIIRRK